MTHPIDQTFAPMFKTWGWIFVDETLHYCHDSLSTLHNVVSIKISHGDINTKHVMWVIATNDEYYYVFIGWGYVILEERNNAFISPKISSTFAFQEGRFCLTSDVESLVYPLSYVCGKISVLPIWVLIECAIKDKNIIGMNMCEWILAIF